MTRKRPDPERRLRQADRLARLLRLLRCLAGSGRWDANSLAEELGCSRRTVHRFMQTLELSGIPWYFDKKIQAYRLPPSFRFPGLGEINERSASTPKATEMKYLKSTTKQLIAHTEQHLKMLRDFCATLEP